MVYKFYLIKPVRIISLVRGCFIHLPLPSPPISYKGIGNRCISYLDTYTSTHKHHRHIHTDIQRHIRTHIPRHFHTRIRRHIHTHIQRYSHTYKDTLTHTYKDTLTHIQRHIHTHLYFLHLGSWIPLPLSLPSVSTASSLDTKTINLCFLVFVFHC